uniref:protein acetyllysine N-acetyltransferase n=1 Tax=Arcella intermedia TaxID=1963864 RepID=A0A6B2LBU1_9EUKA
MEKVKEVAQILSEAKHLVVYTGAGISTSASIPDYRGPQGLWTQMDQGVQAVALKDLEKTLPTFAHRAVTLLVEEGIVKYVTSTNLDGLHIASGLKEEKLAELHGNAYKESCESCHTNFHRPFDCTKQGTRRDHITGRKCDNCGGNLLDNIVNFGEQLPEDHLENAEKNAKLSDVALVLGSSMLVSPACLLPPKAKTLIIVNLQSTPYDNKAITVRGKTDNFMRHLLKYLRIEGLEFYGGREDWEEEHKEGIAVALQSQKEREEKRTAIEEAKRRNRENGVTVGYNI